MEALHGAYVGYAFECQGVCGRAGRDSITLRDRDNPAHRIIDTHHSLGGPTLVVALELVGDVYETTGVYDVVWSVEDAALLKGRVVAGLKQHVVRAPGDD